MEIIKKNKKILYSMSGLCPKTKHATVKQFNKTKEKKELQKQKYDSWEKGGKKLASHLVYLTNYDKENIW